MGKGDVPSTPLKHSWPASRHVILRTNPKRQSCHCTGAPTLHCAGACRGYILAGPGACRGPGLAGCEALPARALPGRTLPGLRNPSILLDRCCFVVFSRQGLAGALGLPGQLVAGKRCLCLVITSSHSRQGQPRLCYNCPCTSKGY